QPPVPPRTGFVSYSDLSFNGYRFIVAVEANAFRTPPRQAARHSPTDGYSTTAQPALTIATSPNAFTRNKLTRHVSAYMWFLLYRIVNALLISSYSSADEYWQSIEVSHYLVFGKGYLTWEWQPEVALRSSLMPLLYVPYYWLLKAPLTALADLCFSKTASILLEPPLARTALVLWLSNWFILSMLTRTFANS
ncbi:hypothetical protein FOZ62_013358, partial [Perkinsus olseni]